MERRGHQEAGNWHGRRVCAGLPGGGIERFGLLSAAGSSAKSRIRYARIMGEKEDAVRRQFFAPASLRVMRTPQCFLLCWGVSFRGRLGRLIRTISVGPLSVNFSTARRARRS